MSDFNSVTLGAGITYEMDNSQWTNIERGTLNINIDYISFDYGNFRDLTKFGSPSNEPLYGFNAVVIRAFASVWF